MADYCDPGLLGGIYVSALSFQFLLISMNASASDEVPAIQPTGGVLLLAQGGSCMSECEAAKKRCMAQHMTTNSYGVKMVTPGGAKRCWAAFHQCKSYCR